MNITFRLEYNPAKDSKQSKPIFIRCTLDRKHKRIHTGISVKATDWNKQKQQVKKSHPQYQVYNQIIQTQLKKVLETYNQLMTTNKELNLHALTETFEKLVEQQNFFVFAFNTKLKEIKSRNKLGTYKRYETALHKFQVFTSGKLPIQEVTYSLLKQYENHLISHHKNSRDTVSANLSVIRTVINEAIKHDLYKGRNPFDLLKLKYTDNTKEKLTLDELQRFIHAPIPNIPSVQIAKDFFYACFLAEGTRAGDMIGMKKENIDFEFTIVLDIDIKHHATASKDRTQLFIDKPEFTITSDTGKRILQWCNQTDEVEIKEEKNIQIQIQECNNIKDLINLYGNSSQNVQTSYKELFALRRDQLQSITNINPAQQNGTYITTS
jgi:hypothetical protein